jgi:hypothetical protein
MKFLDNLSLKQATLIALIGSILALLVHFIQIFEDFTVYNVIGILSQGSISLFLFKLYSKQRGE